MGNNMAPMGGNSGFIAETRLAGGDLRILINRATGQPGSSIR
jgi:hypothetical protein